MANVLSTDKQIAVIGALAEGSSIRSIERITGVHRDTILGLLLKAGEKCERCWNYSTRVGEDKNYPTVCERCAPVLRQLEAGDSGPTSDL